MKDGEEITWNFYFPGGIATDFQSYLNGKATPLSFVALDKTQVIALTKAEINALYLKHPHLMRLETLFSEGAFLDMRRRVESFHLQSAEERYLSLIENNAPLVKKLPNKDIATYLGIAPQSLSRIKRRLFKTH
jgi:CRP-like cAMP-binding protein